MMNSDPLVWLDTLPDMRVPGVPGVPSCDDKDLAGTREQRARVPGVPDAHAGTRGTQSQADRVPAKALNCRKEHAEHQEHAETSGALGRDWGLPPDLADALRRLENMPPPAKVNDREVWGAVVRDALSLARDGWAAKALALGWEASDLFATGPEHSDQRNCLSVWLAGRKLAAMTEWKARTVCGAWFYREAFMREGAPRAAPVWLWNFGRQR